MTPPLVLAALLQLQAPPFDAQGVRWEALPTVPNERTEVDSGRITREGDRVSLYVRNQKTDDPAAERYIAIFVADCRTRQLGIRAAFTYSPAGALVDTQETPPGEVRFTPASEDDAVALVRRACDRN